MANTKVKEEDSQNKEEQKPDISPSTKKPPKRKTRNRLSGRRSPETPVPQGFSPDDDDQLAPLSVKKSSGRRRPDTPGPDEDNKLAPPPAKKPPGRRPETPEPEGFTPDDDKQLALCWLWLHEHDTMRNVASKNGRSWSQVVHKFNNVKNRPAVEAKHIRRRCCRLRLETLDFSAIYNNWKRESISTGQNTPDIELVEIAKKNYYRQVGKPFEFELAWYALRDNPRWLAWGTDQKIQLLEARSNMASNTPHPTANQSELEKKQQITIPTPSRFPTYPAAQIEPSAAPSTVSNAEFLATNSQPLSPPKHRSPQSISSSHMRNQSETTATLSKPKTQPPNTRKRSIDKPDTTKTTTKSSNETEIDANQRKQEKENRATSTACDPAPVEQNLTRLQLEVRRLEAETEYERMLLDIMEKDLTSCTDEYEKQFFIFKKRRILANLESARPESAG